MGWLEVVEEHNKKRKKTNADYRNTPSAPLTETKQPILPPMTQQKKGLLSQDNPFQKPAITQNIVTQKPILPPKTQKEYILPPMVKKPTAMQQIAQGVDNRAAQSKPSVGKWLGDNTLAGISAFNKGVAQTADLMLPDFLTPKLVQRGIDSYKNLGDTHARQAEETNKAKGKGWEIAGKYGVQGVAGAVPNAVLGMMTGGASTAATLAPKATGLMGTISNSVQALAKNPMFWTSFARSTGGTYEEAKQEGASELQAQATAVISGFLNAGVEVGGGIETFGKNGSGVGAWVKSMLEEGREEVVQGVIENLTKKAVYDKDKQMVSLTDEDAVVNPTRALKEFGGGAVVGGILGGAQTGVSKALSANIEGEYRKAGGDDIWGDISTWQRSNQANQPNAKKINLPTREELAQMNAKKKINLPTQEQIAQMKAQNSTAQPILPQNNIGLPLMGETQAQAQNEPSTSPQETQTMGKSQRYQTKQENKFISAISNVLSVPKSANREILRPIAQKLSQEYMETGTISKESADLLFEEAYKNGLMVSDEHYNQYKDLRDSLRSNGVSISDTDKSSIADFNNFRRENIGVVKITQDGVPVDVKYMELSEMYPELFPADIANPADQLQHIAEVAKGITKTETDLDGYYGDNAAEFKEFSKYEFDKELETFKSDMETVRKFNESKAEVAPQNETTVAELKDNLKQLGSLKRNAEKAVANNLLTSKDNVQVDRLLKGEISLADIPQGYNIKGIKAVYEAKSPVYALEKQLSDYNNQRRAALRAEAEKDIETLGGWKKPKGTWSMDISTMERTISRIIPNKEIANNIIEKYFTPVHKQEAERTRFKTKHRDEVRALNLTPKESEAVQFLGETTSEIEELQSQQGKRKLLPRKGDRLLELIKAKNEFLENNPDLDMSKVNNAISKFRQIYNDVYEQMNDSRVKNGYAPVEYRKNYFPHFTENKPDTVMGKFAQNLGIDMEVTDLPTTIAGLTHTFKPGTTWFGNTLQRKGNTTDYDAIRGFDKYIEGVSDVIYHTDNIQRLRVLTETIRYKYSDENIQKQVDAIKDDPNMAVEEKQSKIDEIYKADKTGGSSFVQELEEYTNLLANKKSRMDRGAEGFFGRGVYRIAQKVENRVAANMVAANIRSALTNFAPLTRAAALTNNESMAQAMKDVLKSSVNDDGFNNKSTFLTNRKGSEPLVRTTLEKGSNLSSMPMTVIDDFTSNFIVRAKYYENMKNGMTESAAIDSADKFAADIMGDRSKGATPTIFNAKNPLVKLFTMFQLESMNDLAFLVQDVPQELKGKATTQIASAIFKLVVYSFLYNEISEKLFGSPVVISGLTIIRNAIEGFAGIEIPNTIDAAVGLAKGQMPKIEKKEMTKIQATANLGKNIAENIPFVGGLMGGGRLPVGAALPSFSNTVNNAVGLTSGEKNSKKALAELGKEALKPAAYLLPPFGGGQTKKTIEGISAINKKGSYSVDGEGNDVLQYPTNQTTGDYIKGAVFGKSSLPQAQNWVDSGFKNLSAKDTQEYKDKIAEGENPLKAFGEIKERKKQESLKLLESKTFNKRIEDEVGTFKWQSNVDMIEKTYKQQYGESPGIGIGTKGRIFSYGDAKYELSDELLIERQKLYKQILEKEYDGKINRIKNIQAHVVELKGIKNMASKKADAQFWNAHKDRIRDYKKK